TPAYMAPEQLVGAAIDARADQFAFCVSLHEALLGRRPYEGSSSEEIRANMMQRRRVPIGASCPAEVRKVLERGLEVDPQMRFASLGDLLDELRLAVAHEGELHIQVHTACQAFFAVMHVLSSLCLAHDITGSPRETAASAAPTVSSDATAGQLLLGFIGIAWGTTVLTFLVSGVIWAAVNALGLWRRQAWARKSTMIYAVMGIASLIGIPYAIYALWSLRLPGVKGAFELAARRRR
ncbi:MAG: protein kinase, partial [Myxococcales bacterium]|nr:protein kinase [Myxococcales bacterium]